MTSTDRKMNCHIQFNGWNLAEAKLREAIELLPHLKMEYRLPWPRPAPAVKI